MGGSDGGNPNSQLVAAPNGELYGTAGGGTGTYGNIYGVTPSNAFGVVYNFSAIIGPTDPSTGEPETDEYPGNLILGPDGNFYGTTEYGGGSATGSIFKLTPAGVITTLHSFTALNSENKNSDGCDPYGVTFGTDGNLYGVAASGGPNGTGTVYKLNSSGNFALLHTFSSENSNGGNSDGAGPAAPLTLGSDGNFYGVTATGGTNASGAVFKVSPSGVFTILHSFPAFSYQTNFSNSEGAEPNGALTLGSNGNFYGTCGFAGNGGSGSVFEISPSGTFEVLHLFSQLSSSGYGNGDGAYPDGDLLLASDGNFYGVTYGGGPNTAGTIYRLTPSGTLTNLYSFSFDNGDGNADGENPEAGLTEASDGSLYGTAYQGGASREGTIFKLTVPGLSAPSTSTPAIRFDFNGDGHADLIWYNTGSGDVSVWDMNDESVLQYGATFASLAPSSGWQPVAAPDVNGDGSPT